MASGSDSVQAVCESKGASRWSILQPPGLYVLTIVLTAQKSGHLGHSLAADLLDEFGATEAVRDSLAVLFAGALS
jgi:hypothetical protein